jgi:CBS domain-containing protein
MKEKIDFLAATLPYSVLPDQVLEELANLVEEVDFPENTRLFDEGSHKVKGVHIIMEGSFETFFLDSQQAKRKLEIYGPGTTCGGISILFNKRKPIKTVVAQAGTKALLLPRKIFKAICAEYEEFFDFFANDFGKRMLDDEYAHFYKTNGSLEDNYLVVDQLYSSKIRSIGYRQIIYCNKNTPIFEAAIKMAENKTSCLFVRDEQEQYVGFVTDITLRDRVIAGLIDPKLQISNVMDDKIISISTNAYVYEAILLMFSSKSRYLLIEDEGKFIGFLSRNRLLSEQTKSPLVFIQSVKSATSNEELKAKWQKVPSIVAQLLDRGVHAEIVNEVVTTIADTISNKIIEDVIRKLGPPPAKFVFMVLGSEGRKELSLKTDQDNAIIYGDTPEDQRAMVRSYFLDFATQVSDKLNYVGFVYCDGDYMATNPNWTHSLSHWKYNYKNWIEEALPEAAVKFAAFFDCRAIYGDAEIMDDLRHFVDDELKKPIEKFYVYLAKNALLYEPPLTYFRNIKTQKIESREVFDIKTAMTPIVDLVRVYALQNRIFQKENTGERLRALKDLGVFSQSQFNELTQSYYYLMGLRLKNQANQIIKENRSPNNLIEINNLTKIEKVTLIEIFKTILNFQSGIKMKFTNSLI